MNSRYLKLGSERSDIRELFEVGKIRKAEVGEDNVFDFSLGNPSIPPAQDVLDRIDWLVKNEAPMAMYSYTSAQGDLDVREAVSNKVKKSFNLDVCPNDFIMTVGASGALIGTMSAICGNEEDEIILLAPFFPEYTVYCDTAKAKAVIVETTKDFSIDIEKIEKAITKNTVAIIVNSPNNPTGVIYKESEIVELSALLKKKSAQIGRDILLIADEPYREIAFDNADVPYIPNYYDNTIVCYSYSKSISLPGARIGYVLVSPKCAKAKEIYLSILGALRAYAYVCAPTFFQKVIVECAESLCAVEEYDQNGKEFCSMLTDIGYTCIKPQGAFYLFVKALEDDSKAFSKTATEENLLIVPSDSFGVKGWVRAAFCVDMKTIKNSRSAFERLFARYQK